MGLGEILVELQGLLAWNGKGVFRQYLQSINIRPSTAYDIIKDYRRVADLKLPAILLEIAAKSGVDLSMKKYAPALQADLETFRKAEYKSDAKAALENLLVQSRRSGREKDSKGTTAPRPKPAVKWEDVVAYFMALSQDERNRRLHDLQYALPHAGLSVMAVCPQPDVAFQASA
jgi:hypothetical protein